MWGAPKVPLAEQLGELVLLQQEGKIQHIGLSEVPVEQIEQARLIADIASVQNLYNLANRSAEDVLDYAERENLGFIPWFPIATGELARPGGPLDSAAKRHGASPAQLAPAWLLAAYVSRGQLSSRREPGGQSSTFDAKDVAALARRNKGEWSGSSATGAELWWNLSRTNERGYAPYTRPTAVSSCRPPAAGRAH